MNMNFCWFQTKSNFGINNKSKWVTFWNDDGFTKFTHYNYGGMCLIEETGRGFLDFTNLNFK